MPFKRLGQQRRLRDVLQQLSPQLQARFTTAIYGQSVQQWVTGMMPNNRPVGKSKYREWVLATVVSIADDGTYTVLCDNGLGEIEVQHADLSLAHARPMPDKVLDSALGCGDMAGTEGVRMASLRREDTVKKLASSMASVSQGSAVRSWITSSFTRKQKAAALAVPAGGNIDPAAEKVQISKVGVGTRCCVRSKWEEARIIGFNSDATIQVQYTHSQVSHHRAARRGWWRAGERHSRSRRTITVRRATGVGRCATCKCRWRTSSRCRTAARLSPLCPPPTATTSGRRRCCCTSR